MSRLSRRRRGWWYCYCLVFGIPSKIIRDLRLRSPGRFPAASNFIGCQSAHADQRTPTPRLDRIRSAGRTSIGTVVVQTALDPASVSRTAGGESGLGRQSPFGAAADRPCKSTPKLACTLRRAARRRSGRTSPASAGRRGGVIDRRARWRRPVGAVSDCTPRWADEKSANRDFNVAHSLMIG